MSPLRLQAMPALGRHAGSYGWVVLAVGTLAMMMTLPGRTAAISVFLDPMLAELGLSRSFATGLFMAGTLAGACLLPLIGRAFDRLGVRRGLTATVALFALACVAMGRIEGAIGLFTGFFALRALGQGALLLGAQLSIDQWFSRGRGLAMGVAGAGLAVANVAFPMAIQAGIGEWGWRATYMALGLLLLVVMLPLAAFFRPAPRSERRSPTGELLPDGERHFTLPEAVRTPTFWVFALGVLTLSAATTALVFHHYSLMGTHGLGREAATLLFLPLGLMTAVAHLGFGALMDRLSPRAILASALGVLTATLVAAGFVASPLGVAAYGALLGTAIGGMAAVMTTAWGHYFGSAHLGSIKGVAQTLFVVGTAVGPWPFALCFDATGSYQAALWAALALPVVLLVAVARLPERPAALESPPGAPLDYFSPPLPRV